MTIILQTKQTYKLAGEKCVLIVNAYPTRYTGIIGIKTSQLRHPCPIGAPTFFIDNSLIPAVDMSIPKEGTQGMHAK
jgi:hypothetical protein